MQPQYMNATRQPAKLPTACRVTCPLASRMGCDRSCTHPCCAGSSRVRNASDGSAPTHWSSQVGHVWPLAVSRLRLNRCLTV